MVETTNMLGYNIFRADLGECLRIILGWLRDGGKPRCLACANPHALMVARDDTVFADALGTADILLPDGTGIVLASRVLGGGLL